MDPFQFLQSRMNQVWREFDRDFAPILAGTDRPLALQELDSKATEIKLDVKETPEEVLVAADLPGFPKESIRASVDEDGLLHIRAERGEERLENEPSGEWTWRERRLGVVQRTLQLPKSIDAGRAAHAEFKDGVLKLKFNKRQGQAIEIE